MKRKCAAVAAIGLKGSAPAAAAAAPATLDTSHNLAAADIILLPLRPFRAF